MSMTAVRPYFRTHLDSLGYREWTDAFAFDVPNSIQDNSYSIDTRSAEGAAINQADQKITMQVGIRIMKKGFLNPSEAIDNAIQESEVIVKEICKGSNRLSQSFKNIIFNGMQLEPVNVTDDNTVVMILNFTVMVFLTV